MVNEKELSARRLFAVRLNELLDLTADLPIKRVVAEVNRRRPAGLGRPVSGPRVSDWRRGRHLPESETSFLVMVRVLLEHCRRRGVLPEQVSDGLLDEEQWRRWLRDARASPPDPVTIGPVQIGENAAIDGRADRWAGRCPYRGLAAFDERQAEVFYGREELTAQLVDTLAQRLDRPGILVVAGASGAGKSSLVRAGLLPALASGGLSAESATWPVSVVYPTAAPRDELARTLASFAGVAPGPIRTLLETEPRQAHTVVRDAVVANARTTGGGPVTSSGDRLVLVVDQFERIFTLPEDTDPGAAGSAEAQRADFIAALHAAATRPCGPDDEPTALVIVVIRSDFLADCASYPQLAGAVKDGLFLVGPMSELELRLAITGPAGRAGLQISSALVESILGEMPSTTGEGRYEVGALPLLSEAMRLTWEHREGAHLTSRSYARSGGVAHAIQTSAEAVYIALPAHKQAVTRQVFHRLTKLTGDGRAVRRPMPYQRQPTHQSTSLPPPGTADLPVGHSADVGEVVEAFAEQRLIVVGEQTAEITHDALLHAWPRLRGWLEEDPADRALYSRLHDDAEDWARNQHHGSFLYRGERLTSALHAQPRWQTDIDRYPALSGTARRFLEAGRNAQARATVLRRALVTVLTTLLIAAMIAAAAAMNTQQNSGRQRDVAVSRRLAAQSRLLTGDPALAALLAVAAWRISPTPEARASMLTALNNPQRAVLTNPTRSITAVAVSPDGQTLATGSHDGTVQLWEINTGKPIGALLTGHAQGLISMAFSPDGQMLATGGFDGKFPVFDGMVRLWEVKTRKFVGDLRAFPPDGISAVAFSPDGQMLATGSTGTAQLWNVKTRTLIGVPLTGHAGQVSLVAFSPDGQALATVDNGPLGDGMVRLWEVKTRTPIDAPFVGRTGVSTVAFSRDGRTLATGSRDGTAQLWNAKTRAPLGAPLLGRIDAVDSVAFTPDDQTLAVGSRDGAVQLWNVKTATPTTTLIAGHTGPVSSVAFSPDGQTLATGSRDGTARLWKVKTRMPIAILLSGVTRNSPLRPASVAVSPDGRTLAATSVGGMVQLWEVKTRTTIGAPFAVHPGEVNSVAFSPDGQTLATSGFDGFNGTARLWNVKTRTPIGAPFAGHTGGIYSVAFSPDGQTLATGGGDGTAQLWNVKTHTPIGAPLTGHTGELSLVVFSPDGQTLATGSLDGTARLFNVKTRTPIGAPLSDHTGAIYSVAFSPDGQTLATGGLDGTARLWNVQTRTLIGAPLLGHTGTVSSAAFSPDGQTLATGSLDGTAQRWDIASRTPIGAPLSSHTGVRSVVFSPDGQTLATGSLYDGIVRLWEVGIPRDLLGAVCAIPARSLTRVEWAQYVPEVDFRTVCP
ncbi:nSTAND1 domain-containing NTPase [Sphaerisporangium aureirubrum]|uniref:AAA family ATPase n=1 Tax=Sphaerisporangium aureirubrum TaxID=1544736 RepID=A0ABW1NN27_9ACTN